VVHSTARLLYTRRITSVLSLPVPPPSTGLGLPEKSLNLPAELDPGFPSLEKAGRVLELVGLSSYTGVVRGRGWDRDPSRLGPLRGHGLWIVGVLWRPCME
jgi:hypothetical protein